MPTGPRHLPDAKLRGLLPLWQIAPDAAITRLPGGVSGDVWRIDHNGMQYAAKLTYDLRDTVERGLRAASVVDAAGVRSCVPIPTDTGDLTVMDDFPRPHAHPLALMRWIPGRRFAWGRHPSTMRRAGRILGLIHEALQDFDAPAAIPAYLMEQRSDIAQARRVRSVITEALGRIPDGASQGIIYGDGLQLLNYRGDVGLIDWGTVSRGWLMLDLANQVGEATELVGRVAEHPVVAGYLEVNPALEPELRSMTVFQALNAAWYARFHAWNAIHKPGTWHSERKLDLLLAIAERKLSQTGGRHS
jgi:Ser/Thr protein kinase RdoA (MazF antagonist)